MRRRHAAAWVGCLALLGPMDLRAQAPAAADRAKLRAEVIRLRVEVEMLQLDYDLARADLVEDLKMAKGMAMASGLISSFRVVDKPTDPVPAEVAKARAAEEKAAAEEAEKQAKLTEAEVASYTAEKKKDLARLAAAVAGKRLDLEDAERLYRDREREPAGPGR